MALLELSFDGVVHDLRHVRTTAATFHARTGGPRDFTSRGRPVLHETSNLALSDSATLANERERHQDRWESPAELDRWLNDLRTAGMPD